MKVVPFSIKVFAILFLKKILCNQDSTPPAIYGVGLFEKTARSGVPWASLAGGAEIMIYGMKFDPIPNNNEIELVSSQLGQTFLAPPLSGNNIFRSAAMDGKLQFTLPSLSELLQVNSDQLSSINSLSFQVQTQINEGYGALDTLTCNAPTTNCMIYYNRAYTPILFEVVPAVSYYGSMIGFIVDPKGSQAIKDPNKMPFNEARIGPYLLNFEDIYDETSSLYSYLKNQILGVTGDTIPSIQNTPSILFDVGYALNQVQQLTRCSYDGTECYQVKTLASIDSISSDSGYTTGGQILTITGKGFTSNNIKVKIGGTNCKVIAITSTQVKCQTQAADSESQLGIFAGQNGLILQTYYPDNSSSIVSYQTMQNLASNLSLSLHLESFQNMGTYFGRNFTGFFKAPASTNYKFYLSCDDYCQVFLSTNNDPSNKQVIITSPTYTQFRDYYSYPQQQSTWIPLIQDQYYYIEVAQFQGSGSEHVSVAVEIEKESGTHHNNKKVIQNLQINQELIREQTVIIIDKPDNGNIDLYFFQNFVTKSGPYTISASSTANQLKNAVSSFFTITYGAWISVDLQMTDANGNNVTDMTQSVRNRYTIYFQKSIATPTSIKLTYVKKGSNSTITTIAPAVGIKSNAPLQGPFSIICVNLDSTQNTTDDIPYNASPYAIQQAISKACSSLIDKFEVLDGSSYKYYQDGRDLNINFNQINGPVAQFQIQSGTVTPLTGNQITYLSTTPSPYSSNLFYSPIPFELLYSMVTKPQVQMTVNDLPAVCISLDCSYMFVNPTSSLSSYTYTGSSLSFTGTNLPTTGLTIQMGNTYCLSISSTSTSIQCTLSPTQLVSGSWIPTVKDENGIIPFGQNVSPQLVPISISTVSPNTELNPKGGNILTITGSNFPQNLNDANNFVISLSDGTSCSLISSSQSQIQCQIQSLSSSAAGQTLTLTLNINDQSDSTQVLTIHSNSATISALSPSTYSPVLKASFIISMTSGYNGNWNRDDFTVQLVPQSNSLPTVNLNVMNADSQTSTLLVKYPGARSGMYNLQVHSQSYGFIDSTGITFQAAGIVTSISPTSGSVNGGTLLTITGYTFSADPTDNPVQIAGLDCEVLSSSATQITCRTPLRQTQSSGSDTVYTYLKAAEEAVCQDNGNCIFTWSTQSTPTLTSYSVNFDSSSLTYQITFIGNNFDGSTDQISVLINDTEQEVVSVSSTQVVATVSDILDYKNLNIKLYLLSGTPNGYQQLSAAVTLIPKLVSITPNVGSSQGSVIIANVQGIGLNSQGISLITNNQTNICQSLTIIGYGLIKCLTKVGTFVTSTSIYVKVNTVAYACSNADTTKCQYKTDDTQFPQVSSVQFSQDLTQITFTGTNFFTSGFTVSSIYNGISSSSATIDSQNLATATFSSGIPVSNTAVIPQLFFQSSSSIIGHFAINSQPLSNPITISSSTSNSLTCSFAGGCSLILQGSGIATSLASGGATVSVCGLPCTYSSTDSTTSQGACTVPALSTLYSILNYKIEGIGMLMGSIFASNMAQADRLIDMDNTYNYQDSSSTCYFGMSFNQGFVGVVSQVKFWMNQFLKSSYSGQLKFQGSADGVTYTTLFTVRDEIHEGWNYYDYSNNNLKYRFYRFQGSLAGACNVGEFVLKGVVAIDDNNSQYSCSVNLTIGSTSTILQNQVTYSSSFTPVLNSINPRYGTVKGGTLLTLTGQNFPTVLTDIKIVIDERICNVNTATLTQITCTTSPRPGLYPNTKLEFNINGKGAVATQGLLYRYVNVWSDEDTWGGEFLPIQGDSIWVPSGMHLLVDVDSTPILDLVLVEGSLIIAPDSDPNHLRTFDATYIMVRDGYMEVGTEQFPYSSKLIITMHGDKYTPEMPIYGSKCIAVRNGILDLHGIPRNPTWTSLETTANIGDNTITLHTAVDWQVGETIVIAPTGYDNYEAEVRTISAITAGSNPVVTLNDTLRFKHYAGVETYGSDTLEMRAEVGLLTRNVIYRGDPETSSINQFGAHIMLHSMGDESLTGRIEYIDIQDVGQAFQLGRYPLHFHIIGTVSNSYIRGNSIHNTYNRAVTIHHVSYLRVLQNVAYNTMGHTFFIEDAFETKNLLDGNLAIQTKRSWSLLNTDQTSASFWITHPDNIFRNNHAAGSDRYGFWFDLQPHSTGPSFDPNICPINAQLGEFDNNVAHSNGRYGLRIHHGHIPRTYPCQSQWYDPSNATDPFHTNPLITANFTNLVSYKNGVNGAIVEKVGDVRFSNFKIADNKVCGIEFSETDQTADFKAGIYNALIVGHSANSENFQVLQVQYGIITPRTENFTANNIRFWNFDQDQQAAIGSCSHCMHAASTDSGARTVTFAQIYFNNVNQKIRYQTPFRDIFFDLDGTLTGLGPNTWTTPYWKHNDWPECTNIDSYNGLVCNSSVQVRRIEFGNYSPGIFFGQPINILQYDDNQINQMNSTQLSNYIDDTNAYTYAVFRVKTWAMPYVTNHKYKINWGNGLDFTNMQFTLSERWKPTDLDLQFIFNFTDVREAVNITAGSQLIPNGTLISKSKSQWLSGDNVVYNDTATRKIQVAVNGKDYSRNPVNMVGIRCLGSCLTAINQTTISTTVRYWSNATSWDNGTLPVAGDNVEIKSGWNMILDLPITPILNNIQINGRLTFMNGTNITLQANYIFVRAGELVIGNSTHPYTGNANITLYGKKQNQYIVFTNNIEAGDKILVNTGFVSMYGIKRSYMSRLKKNVWPGNNTIYVEMGLDWKMGDQIGIAPTSFDAKAVDYAIIQSYNTLTGQVILDRNMNYYHFGQSTSTASQYSGVDMRGEVFLLTRNILIQGTDDEAWGCQVVTSDFMEEDGSLRAGQTNLYNVQIKNCSQYDTYNAALRFDQSSLAWSQLSHVAIHHGLGWGININGSANILIENSIVFNFVNFGINILSSTNITIDNNLIAYVFKRNFTAFHETDPQAGLAVCVFVKKDVCNLLQITNNIVTGTILYGIVAPGHNCGDTQDKTFRNNIAHSIEGIGIAVYPIPENANHLQCFEASNIIAYKNQEVGAFASFKTNQVQFTNLILIDNGQSAGVNIGQEGDSLKAILKNSIIYGENANSLDCPSQNYCIGNNSIPGCRDKVGALIPEFTVIAKELFPSPSELPMSRIDKDASFGGQSLFQNVTFANFYSNQTFCGKQQSVLGANTFGPDYHPILKISKSQFVNVDQSAFGYLFSPIISWAVIDDCGLFPCTGPLNIIVKYDQITYGGTATPVNLKSSFQMVSNNPNAINAVSNCKLYNYWNANYCENDNLGILLFESLDADRYKRTFSPIILRNNATSFANTMNEFMDHTWDGFYTGQIRLSRFPSLIETNRDYEVIYTGTPPESQRFILIADNGGSLIQIKYLKAGAYQVTDSNKNVIASNVFNNQLGYPQNVSKTTCGENRYIGVQNILQFYITRGCMLYIQPVNAILGSIRMNWTLSGFYSAGGSTKFVDRLASALGIYPSTIKVVSVYTGSVVVAYQITSKTNNSAELAQIKNLLTKLIQTGKLQVGAPILSAEYDGQVVQQISINVSSSSSQKQSIGQPTSSSQVYSQQVVTIGNNTIVIQGGSNESNSQQQQQSSEQQTSVDNSNSNKNKTILINEGLATYKIIIIALSILAVLLGILIFVIVLYKKAKAKERALYEKTQTNQNSPELFQKRRIENSELKKNSTFYPENENHNNIFAKHENIDIVIHEIDKADSQKNQSTPVQSNYNRVSYLEQQDNNQLIIETSQPFKENVVRNKNQLQMEDMIVNSFNQSKVHPESTPKTKVSYQPVDTLGTIRKVDQDQSIQELQKSNLKIKENSPNSKTPKTIKHGKEWSSIRQQE